MVRPRIDRYEAIVAFLKANKGFQASPTQLRTILNLDCTKVAMSHYILNMKKKKTLFEIDGKYYLPHQIPMEACNEHDEPLPCGYCKTLEHLDNCPVYKKHNQCACLLLEEI